MANLLKIPGMVDPHVHLRDLAWSHKATFASETAAALAGGYWAVFDMPNTPPNTIDRAALDTKLAAIGSQAICDWGLYFGASQDDNTAEIAQVSDVCGLKIYNNATTGTLLMDDQAARDRVYAAWNKSRAWNKAGPGKRGGIIALHAEEETIPHLLELVRRYNQPTHFCHISTADEIYYLNGAKREGLPVTVGVTPHHLFLTQEDVATLGSLGRMKPELKTQADVDVLWAGIADGTVDVVESDHAPHTLAEKAGDPAPSGVPGLETTLPLMGLAVQEGRITAERLVELVALNPQRIWGLTPPPDTYTLVDLDDSYLIERENLRTLCGWSPFEGQRVYGRVREVWIHGRQVFDGENILAKPGSGVNLFEG